MTKLYCPKGHETTSTYKNQKAMGLISGIQGFNIRWCKDCGDRPYFETDCLTEPETVDIQKKMSTESQIAVDRVVEALSYAVDRDDPWFFNIGWEECCDSLGFKVINRFKSKLKELNK